MNVDNLREGYPKLIAFMESANYSKTYIGKTKSEVKRILANADKKGWKSYSDIYHEYENGMLSSQNLRSKLTFLGLICSSL